MFSRAVNFGFSRLSESASSTQFFFTHASLFKRGECNSSRTHVHFVQKMRIGSVVLTSLAVAMSFAVLGVDASPAPPPPPPPPVGVPVARIRSPSLRPVAGPPSRSSSLSRSSSPSRPAMNGDLMAQIRQGIKLNKVNPNAPKPRSEPLPSPPKSPLSPMEALQEALNKRFSTMHPSEQRGRSPSVASTRKGISGRLPPRGAFRTARFGRVS